MSENDKLHELIGRKVFIEACHRGTDSRLPELSGRLILVNGDKFVLEHVQMAPITSTATYYLDAIDVKRVYPTTLESADENK